MLERVRGGREAGTAIAEVGTQPEKDAALRKSVARTPPLPLSLSLSLSLSRRLLLRLRTRRPRRPLLPVLLPRLPRTPCFPPGSAPSRSSAGEVAAPVPETPPTLRPSDWLCISGRSPRACRGCKTWFRSENTRTFSRDPASHPREAANPSMRVFGGQQPRGRCRAPSREARLLGPRCSLDDLSRAIENEEGSEASGAIR